MTNPPIDPKDLLSQDTVSETALRQIAFAAGILIEPAASRAQILDILTTAENLLKVIPRLHLLPEIILAEAKLMKANAEHIQAKTAAANAQIEEVTKTRSLREALDTSTKVNRTLGLSFAALMFYILLIIASTTDLQLFLPESKVRLPILDVELPLLGFYTVVPYLILIFHFHLLINLKHHQDKYRIWRENAKKEDKDTGLDPILINFVDSYKRRFSLLRVLLLMMISISVFYFPLIDIILMQWRFGAYHSFLISSLQWAAALLDAGLIVVFFYKIFLRKEGVKPSWRRRIFSLGNTLALGISVVGVLVWLVALRLQLMLSDPDVMKSWSLLWTPRIDLTNTADQVGEVADGYVLHYLKNSSNEEEANVKASEKFGKPLNLEGRDFRFAILDGVNLARANMKACRMERVSMIGAHFEGADLSGGDFLKADLQGTSFVGANLTGTGFEFAILNGSNFENTDVATALVQGAKAFIRANFKNANLAEENLEGADLRGAYLEGANLEGTHLEGANLGDAHLEGAYLRGAHLEGTNLTLAHLEGTDLVLAHLEGATLTLAYLEGADASRAFLRGVDFDEHELDLALVKGADWASTPNWGEILSKAPSISRDYPESGFEEQVRVARKLCASQTSDDSLPQGITEETQLKMLPAIGCRSAFIMKGILFQFEAISEIETQKALLDSCCALCKDKVLEVKKKWAYIVEGAPCLEK